MLVSSGAVASSPRKLPNGEHTLPQTRWVLHDSVAYVFPEAPTVHVRNDVKTGSWRDINNSPAQSDQRLEVPVFSAWLDFGPQVRNGTYAYIIRPGVSASDMSQYKNPVVVLRNDSTLQAVRHTTLRIVQAAFYQADILNDSDGLRLQTDKPVLLMAQYQVNGDVALTLSNPKNEALRVQVSVNRQLKCYTCTWSEKSRTTIVSLDLPSGEQAGQSVTKLLKNTNPPRRK